MERSGTYAELFTLQAAAFGLDARQASPDRGSAPQPTPTER